MIKLKYAFIWTFLAPELEVHFFFMLKVERSQSNLIVINYVRMYDELINKKVFHFSRFPQRATTKRLRFTLTHSFVFTSRPVTKLSLHIVFVYYVYSISF